MTFRCGVKGKVDLAQRIVRRQAGAQIGAVADHLVIECAQARFARFRFDPAEQLARTFWPGPLMLVLQYQPQAGISELVSAGLPTLALRVPAHPVGQAVLRAAATPIAAPSANGS